MKRIAATPVPKLRRAEAMVVAAEQCAWWIANDVSVKAAARSLGLKMTKGCLSWRDVQPHVAQRWLSTQACIE